MRLKKNKKPAGTRHLFVHKGDTVFVLSGKDLGRRGKVLEALPQVDKVIVEGVNIVTRHQKQRGGRVAAQQQAGRIQKPAALWACKVMVVCPSCDKPTRVQYQFLESGVKVRWCDECNSPIDHK